MKGSTKFWLCLLVFLLGCWAYGDFKSFAVIVGVFLAALLYLWLGDLVLSGGEKKDSEYMFGRYNSRKALKWFNSKLDKHLDI